MHYVAFLRAINVGGTSVIKMVDLVKLFESLGFEQVKTYIQSGNVFFDAPRNLLPRQGELSEVLRGLRGLETLIEEALAKKLPSSPKVMVRTIEELKEVTNFVPFQKPPSRSVSQSSIFNHQSSILSDLGDNTKLSLYVAFLKTEPNAEQRKLLTSFENEHEKFHLRGREIYCLIRKDVGKVGVYAKGAFEKKLGVQMTMRNYLTVRKMVEWVGKHPTPL